MQFACFHIERVEESGAQGSAMKTVYEYIGWLHVVVDLSIRVAGEHLDSPQQLSHDRRHIVFLHLMQEGFQCLDRSARLLVAVEHAHWSGCLDGLPLLALAVFALYALRDGRMVLSAEGSHTNLFVVHFVQEIT